MVPTLRMSRGPSAERESDGLLRVSGVLLASSSASSLSACASLRRGTLRSIPGRVKIQDDRIDSFS